MYILSRTVNILARTFRMRLLDRICANGGNECRSRGFRQCNYIIGITTTHRAGLGGWCLAWCVCTAHGRWLSIEISLIQFVSVGVRLITCSQTNVNIRWTMKSPSNNILELLRPMGQSRMDNNICSLKTYSRTQTHSRSLELSLMLATIYLAGKNANYQITYIYIE